MPVPDHAASPESLVMEYLRAKRSVMEHGYSDEILWQRSRSIDAVTVNSFFHEATWVVLSAGLNERVVSRRFAMLKGTLQGLDPYWINRSRGIARQRALHVFRHEAKVAAIVEIATRVSMLGEPGLKVALQSPESFLRSLPYIGPVTWRHLAKNLGLQVAKADRHLVRFAAAAGRPSVDELCSEISQWLGEPVSVVDLVLWRWAAIHVNRCNLRCVGDSQSEPHARVIDHDRPLVDFGRSAVVET